MVEEAKKALATRSECAQLNGVDESTSPLRCKKAADKSGKRAIYLINREIAV